MGSGGRIDGAGGAGTVDEDSGAGRADRAADERLVILRQLASTIDAVEEIMVVVDPHGRIVRVNKALTGELNLDFKDIIGRPMTELFGDLKQIRDAVSGRIPAPDDVHVPFNDCVYQLSCFPNVDPDGRRIGTIFVFRDVTEERRLREHLVEAEKLSTLSAVLTGVAHEINNPLAGVIGFTQLARELNKDPEVEECLATIQTEADNVTRIVRNLVEFARRSRKGTRAVRVADVVDRTMDLLAYEIRLAGIRPVCAIPDDLPMVRGSRQQLQQALVEVMLFVVRAARKVPGGVDVSLRATATADVVELTVEAKGVEAASEEESPVIRLPPARDGRRSWASVSLATAHGILMQHGGALLLGSGTQGRTVLTLSMPAAGHVSTVGDDGGGLGDLEIPGVKVLVVDDDRISATLITNILEMAGADVDTAKDGGTAWEMLHERDYDLLVIDLRMPGMDGVAVIERLAEEGERLAGRIIAVTGDTLSGETLDFLEDSGLPYVRKPFTLGEIRRAVRRVLSGSGPR